MNEELPDAGDASIHSTCPEVKPWRPKRIILETDSPQPTRAGRVLNRVLSSGKLQVMHESFSSVAEKLSMNFNRLLQFSVVVILSIQTALAGDPRQPDIIFILADDLGYADTGVTGARGIGTPHIDRLAAEGISLTNAYSSSAICSPTRTALLTGSYAQRFRLGLEEPLRSSDAKRHDLSIPENRNTIASVLRDQGYETALVGKWHLGLPPEHGPLAHGYNDFFGIAQGAADYFRHTMINNGKSSSNGLYQGNEEVRRQGYLTDIFGDEAVRKIRSSGERPLFLSLHFTAPHWPWEGRGDFSVSDQLINTPHHDGGSLAVYREMVEVMDDNVGKVLAALEESGRSDNAIVIFTSDNGGERFSDTWPFVGVKGELLEGGIRVPLFIRWPGKIKAGSSSGQVTASMDFLPTLLAASGVSDTQSLYDGVNILPQLLEHAEPVERTLFWRFKAGSQGAVRQGAWKYLKLGDKEHLFNLDADPRERVMLKDKFPDKFTELRTLYESWNREVLPYPADSFSENVKNSYSDRY